MEKPVLVRSTEREWDLKLLMVLGVVAAAVGMLLDHNRSWMASLTLMSGGTVALIAAIVLQRRRRARRRWVADTGSGFEVVDADGERSYGDDEITSVAIRIERKYKDGAIASVIRRFLIWTENDAVPSQPIEMVNQINAGNSDPLGDLITRLNDRLVTRAEAQLAAGRPVSRPGWSLTAESLRFDRKEGPLMTRLDEIVAVDSIDDHLCLWHKSDDAAWMRVPLNQPDAYLLGQILSNRLAKRPPVETTQNGKSLGRVLFERKASGRTLVAGIIAAALFFLVSLVLFIVGLSMRDGLVAFFSVSY